MCKRDYYGLNNANLEKLDVWKEKVTGRVMFAKQSPLYTQQYRIHYSLTDLNLAA